jgi:ketosteroid isomerase-like protein
MTEQANVARVQELYQAFGRGDIEAILEQLADDVEWYDPGPPAVPHAGRYHGRDDVARFFSVASETLEFEDFQPRAFVASGDLVVALGSLRARVKATGRSYDNEWAMAWVWRDGKVASWQIYEDTARELAAHVPNGDASERG